MAKVPKQRQTSTLNPRSRAAKRATSPSIDIDKSIKETPRASGAGSLLGPNHNAGISKKRKSKQLTRGQKVRQERGLARAEVVIDQLSKKVEESKAKLKRRHARKSQWNDINEVAAKNQSTTSQGPHGVAASENDHHMDSEQRQMQELDDVDIETKLDEEDIGSAAPSRQKGSIGSEEARENSKTEKDQLDLIN